MSYFLIERCSYQLYPRVTASYLGLGSHRTLCPPPSCAGLAPLNLSLLRQRLLGAGLGSRPLSSRSSRASRVHNTEILFRITRMVESVVDTDVAGDGDRIRGGDLCEQGDGEHFSGR